MENNKYYTPSIEEFHVGFKFELLEPLKQGAVSAFEGWQKLTVKDISLLSNKYFKELFKQKYIRVKYLDSIDIQDLGFELLHNDGDALEFNIADKYDEITYLWFDYETHNIDIYVGDGYDKDYLFQGTIKNKSELKKVLKMIGVK